MILSETLLATCFLTMFIISNLIGSCPDKTFSWFFLQLCLILFCINSFNMYILSQFMYYIVHEIVCFYFVKMFLKMEFNKLN